MNNSSCKFKYRNSIFKNNSLLIISVDFKTDCKKELNIEYNSIINHMDNIGFKKTNLSLETLSNLICDIRNKTLPDPNIIPNAGSFFKNAEVKISEIDDSEFSLDELIIWDIGNNKVKVGSARLIELVKDRIPKSKNVEIYKNHALVLVTNTYATQAEVLDYANEIIKIVKKVFNIELQIEPTLVE